MSNKKAQPFTISRTNSGRSSFSFLDKSLSNSFEETTGPMIKRQGSFLSRQNSLALPQTSYKNCYNIFKTDINIMPELLEQYSQANLYYRDEEFTQQSEIFITKVAQDKKIPKEFRAKFPLYQILVAISKIFMLNEYEIVAFACTLDHCNWKVEEVVYEEEGNYLEEFPANFGVEISEECKSFIVYLLIITFSLKQYLNDKSDIDPIQAYCEKICDNFQPLFNRYVRQSSIQKFNYSAPEINRKFKQMSKREYNDRIHIPKDYNMLADQIMTLTGSYNSKGKDKDKTPAPATPQPKPQTRQQQSKASNLSSAATKAFNEFAPQPHVPKPHYPENVTQRPNKGLSRQLTFDSIEELARIPTSRAPIQRQDTISQLLTNFSSLRRQESFDFTEKGGRKKVKWDSDRMIDGDKDKGIGNGDGEGDDYVGLGMPGLSKKASNVSQIDDIPTFSRLNSNLSFLYEK